MARRKVTVQEAADRLDASVDAVRQRIKRGKLERAEAEDPSDPRVYVWLDLDQTESRHKVESEEGHEHGNGEALVESLQAQVGHLLRELEIRNEELRRKDHLLAAAIERIPPQLEAPRQENGSSAVAGGAEGYEPHRTTGGAQAAPEAAEKRPWWRRAFGA
jgi:hypothetical protein